MQPKGLYVPLINNLRDFSAALLPEPVSLIG
jgi:hypothetical protein